MKTYRISFHFVFHTGELTKAFHAKLNIVRPEIEEIVARRGGEVITDGTGFGVMSQPDRHAMYMLVKTSEEAAKEISALSGVFIEEHWTAEFSQKKTKPLGPK